VEQGHAQETQYSYDSYGRLTQVRHYMVVAPPFCYCQPYWQEAVNQRVDYAYDVNPAEPGFSQNGWGRLTAVGFHNEQQNGRESFNYQYSYDTAGHVVKQRLQMWAQPGSRPDPNQPGNDLPVNFDATYGWDNEGRMSSLGYPADQNGNPGPTDSFTYDAMGRLNNYGATWGPAGELLSFDNGQTRSYNSLGQLESIFSRVQTGWQGTTPVYTTLMDMHYYYTAGQNNGRVAQTVDGITHETVNYTYDQLNRLSTAQASNGSWGQIYSYDGWGNLNSKAPYGGQGPTYSATPDPRYNGGQDPTVTDWLYATDVEDRPIGTQPATGYGQSFTYDQAGKMVFTLSVSSLPLDESGNPAGNYPCEVRFYGINGQRLAAYSCFYSLGGGNTGFQYSLKEYDHKVAGILTEWGGKYLATDRLGSIRADYSGGQYSYYPYGEAKTAPSGQAGLYADLEDPVRGYDSYAGRWSKPDPLGMKAAVLTNPITWNRYAYANGDPVNFVDPAGTNAMSPENPGYCPPEMAFCGSGFWDPTGTAGGGGGGSPTGSLGAVLDALTQYYQGLGYSVLPGAVALPAGGIGITICAGSGICEVIAIGVGAGAAIWGTWELGKWIGGQIWRRGQRDPAQVRNLPRSVPVTQDPEEDCTPPDPDQKGPSGMTYKWQQVSSSTLAVSGSAPVHWHWTLWNFDISTCNWWYNGRGEGFTDPGPGYVLIPGIW
jgi:RHS repeat-associated protein